MVIYHGSSSFDLLREDRPDFSLELRLRRFRSFIKLEAREEDDLVWNLIGLSEEPSNSSDDIVLKYSMRSSSAT